MYDARAGETHLNDGEHSVAGDALDEVTRRVQKLLAVAERTANEDESDAFSRKAAELIARYRLSPGALRSTDPDDFVVHEHLIGRGAYVRARFLLLSEVAESMGCLATFTTGPDGTTAQVSGPQREVNAVMSLFHSLHQQMAVVASRQRRATAAATQRFRRAFMFGFAERVGEMLREMQRVIVDEHDNPHSLLPMLRQQRERVHEFALQRLGPIRSASAPSPVVADGASAGRQAARDADIGRTSVGEQRAIGSGR